MILLITRVNDRDARDMLLWNMRVSPVTLSVPLDKRRVKTGA